MGKEAPKKFFRSRLARVEEKKSLKKAFIFVVLTISLILTLIFFGIPTLVRVAVLFAEIKSSSTQTTEQTDSIPPSPPQLDDLSEHTKDQNISLTGFAEQNSTVEVFLNGSPVGTVTTNSEGKFSIEKVSLSQGKNEIYAIAADKAGNKSQPSETLTTNFDNTPPDLTVDQPQDGTTFNEDRQKKMKISGQTEPDISLTLNDRLIILNQEGKFSTDMTLSEGENALKIIATDKAGNQTEKDLRVTFNP